jgi:hypothetical protein
MSLSIYIESFLSGFFQKQNWEYNLFFCKKNSWPNFPATLQYLEIRLADERPISLRFFKARNVGSPMHGPHTEAFCFVLFLLLIFFFQFYYLILNFYWIFFISYFYFNANKIVWCFLIEWSILRTPFSDMSTWDKHQGGENKLPLDSYF